MTSLVFVMSDGHPRALVLTSGEVIDVSNLSPYDITADTERLRQALGKMTVAQILTTLGNLGFNSRMPHQCLCSEMGDGAKQGS